MLDPQGKVIQQTLNNMGIKNVNNVRQGKYFELEINEKNYDNTRLPGWTDRILYFRNDNIKCIEYNSFENFKYSDHLPIYGIYLINLKNFQHERIKFTLMFIKQISKKEQKWGTTSSA